jgi:hypothetical protein
MSESPKPGNPADDGELEDFLSGRGSVSQAYRESRAGETTPPDLDASVLRLARQALEKSVPARRGWQSLRLPVALAATVVLSFSAFLMLRDERRATPMVESQPVAAPMTAPAAEAMMDAGPAAQQRSAESKPAPVLAPLQKRAEKSESGRAPSAVAGGRRQAISPERLAEEDAIGSSAQPQAGKDMPSAPAAAGLASGSAMTEMQDRVPVDPEEWIRQIRQLHDDRQLTLARAQLEAMRKTYPEYLVPEDLKDLLPAPNP